MKSEIEEILAEFIEWLKDKNDVFYAFDNPDTVIKEFYKYRDRTDNW